ncbi:MAG TPA: 4a-hydroxytetrahydrobiopterin dehydratase [Burkholderiaceae bacterium]
MVTTKQLLAKKCMHSETALDDAAIADCLRAVDGWAYADGKIVKQFVFNNYYETLSFINAIAYVVHAEDHHPELLVTFNRCTVRFDTHSVNGGKGGISDNDFICAAKIDAVYQQSY